METDNDVDIKPRPSIQDECLQSSSCRNLLPRNSIIQRACHHVQLDYDRTSRDDLQDRLLPASVSLDDQFDLVCLVLAQALNWFKYKRSL